MNVLKHLGCSIWRFIRMSDNFLWLEDVLSNYFSHFQSKSIRADFEQVQWLNDVLTEMNADKRIKYCLTLEPVIPLAYLINHKYAKSEKKQKYANCLIGILAHYGYAQDELKSIYTILLDSIKHSLLYDNEIAAECQINYRDLLRAKAYYDIKFKGKKFSVDDGDLDISIPNDSVRVISPLDSDDSPQNSSSAESFDSNNTGDSLQNSNSAKSFDSNNTGDSVRNENSVESVDKVNVEKQGRFVKLFSSVFTKRNLKFLFLYLLFFAVPLMWLYEELYGSMTCNCHCPSNDSLTNSYQLSGIPNSLEKSKENDNSCSNLSKEEMAVMFEMTRLTYYNTLVLNYSLLNRKTIEQYTRNGGDFDQLLSQYMINKRLGLYKSIESI